MTYGAGLKRHWQTLFLFLLDYTAALWIIVALRFKRLLSSDVIVLNTVSGAKHMPRLDIVLDSI